MDIASYWCPISDHRDYIQNQLSKDAYRQVQLLQAELGTNAGGSPTEGGRDLLSDNFYMFELNFWMQLINQSW